MRGRLIHPSAWAVHSPRSISSIASDGPGTDFWHTWRVTGENGFNSLHTRCLNEGTYCGLGNQPR
jgi:hypothetical protein